MHCTSCKKSFLPSPPIHPPDRFRFGRPTPTPALRLLPAPWSRRRRPPRRPDGGSDGFFPYQIRPPMVLAATPSPPAAALFSAATTEAAVHPHRDDNHACSSPLDGNRSGALHLDPSASTAACRALPSPLVPPRPWRQRPPLGASSFSLHLRRLLRLHSQRYGGRGRCVVRRGNLIRVHCDRQGGSDGGSLRACTSGIAVDLVDP